MKATILKVSPAIIEITFHSDEEIKMIQKLMEISKEQIHDLTGSSNDGCVVRLWECLIKLAKERELQKLREPE